MKKLNEYIESYELTEALLLESEIDIEMIDEGLFNGIKNIFKTVKDKIGKRGRAAVQAFLVTLANDKNGILLPNDKEKLIEGSKDIDKYYDNLVDIIKKYRTTKDALKDPVFIYACINVKELTEEKIEQILNENPDIKSDIKNEIKSNLKAGENPINIKTLKEVIIPALKTNKIYKDIHKEYTENLQLVDSILDNISSEDKKAAIEARKNAEEAIKSGKSNEGNGSEETSKPNEENDKTTENEIKQETTEVINDNSDIIGPLSKKAGIDPKKLRSFVVDKLKYIVKDGKFNGSRKESDIPEADILGTCIMICGAVITQDQDAIERIAKRIGTTASEILNI